MEDIKSVFTSWKYAKLYRNEQCPKSKEVIIEPLCQVVQIMPCMRIADTGDKWGYNLVLILFAKQHPEEVHFPNLCKGTISD